jgi:5-hydroxyisourate hydrolase
MSIHVVDVSRGVVARGMRIEVLRIAPEPAVLADGPADATGLLSAPALMGPGVTAGRYEVRFHVADYYRSQSVPLPAEPFLDVVCYAFGIDDAAQHYHLPMKTTPWGYSCFRGGA